MPRFSFDTTKVLRATKASAHALFERITATPSGRPVDVLSHYNRYRLHEVGFRSRHVKGLHLLESRGRGDLGTLVLLHGYGAIGIHYGGFAVKLRRYFSRIVMPDLPMHGWSTGGELVFSQIQEGLIDALDQVVDSATVYGNSMGGLAAFGYAMKRPRKVRNLIVSSPAGGRVPPDKIPQLARTFHLGDHRAALAFVDKLLVDKYPTRHLIAWEARRSFHRPGMDRLFKSIGALSPDDLAQLELPILLIWGRNERLLLAEQREFFRAHLPEHAQILEPEAYGHSPHLENPAELADVVAKFVGDGRSP